MSLGDQALSLSCRPGQAVVRAQTNVHISSGSHGVRIAAIVSQAAAFFQALSLIAAFGAGRLTDAVNLFGLLAAAPMAIVARGIVLPYAMVRPGFSRWRQLNVGAVILGGALGPAGAAYLNWTGSYSGVDLLMLGAGFGAMGMTLSAASMRACRLACEGRPVTIAAVTIPTNVAFGAAAWVPLGAPEARICVAAVLAGAIQALITSRIRTRLPGAAELARGLAGDRSQLVSLAAGALVGYAGPTVLQTMAATLPPGQLAILGLIAKVLGALVNLGIGAALLARSNWMAAGTKPLQGVLSAVVAGTWWVSLVVALLPMPDSYRPVAVAAALWFGLSCWALIVNKWIQLAGDSAALRTSAFAGAGSYIVAASVFWIMHTGPGFMFASCMPLLVGIVVCELYLRSWRALLALVIAVANVSLVLLGDTWLVVAVGTLATSLPTFWYLMRERPRPAP